MSVNHVHARNLILNWGSYAATLVVMFLLSPFVVGSLDPVSYGIWSLLNVLSGYMGLLDLGVRASVGRHIALYLGKGDEKAIDETIRTGLGFFSLSGVFIIVAGIGIGWLFPHAFQNIPEDHYDTVRMLLPVMGINVWLSAVAAIYSSVLTAHNRFDFARCVDLAVLIVRTIGTIVALTEGTGLWGLAGAVLISNIVALIGNFVLSHKQHRGLKSWPFLYSKVRLREITRYGVAAFLSKASMKIIGQTDLIIAGAILTVASVREYSVGAMLVYYTGTLIGIIDGTFFPSMQKAVGRDDITVVGWLFFRQIRIAMLFGVPAFVGMALFARPFISLWMMQPGFDDRSVIVAAGVMSILAMAKLPLVFVGGSVGVLAATGRIRVSATLTVVEAIVNLAISILFTVRFGWGLYGIAASTLVATLLVRAFWIPLLACRELDIKFVRMLFQLIIPSGVAAVGFAIICMLALQLFPPQTWTVFALDVGAVLLIYLAIGIPALLPKEYRQMLAMHGRMIFRKGS